MDEPSSFRQDRPCFRTGIRQENHGAVDHSLWCSVILSILKNSNPDQFKLQIKEPIPACSKGNKKKWSKMQCDPGTQYCWCVSPKTGIYDDTYRVIQKDRQLKCR